MILDKMAAVLKKDLLTGLRYRNGFVFAIVAPALQLATFYYLSRAIGPEFRPEGMPYFLFLMVGTGFYTFLIAGVHSFLQTVQESQQNGTLEVLMTTSTPPAVLLLLSAVSAFGSGALQLIFYIGAGLILFAAPHVNVVGCVLVLAFSVAISIAVGLFAAALQIAVHKGSAVLWLLGSTAWLMAGTLFPVLALPRPLQLLSTMLPFTHSLTGMRLAFVEGTSQSALTHEIEMLLLFAIALVPLGIMFFVRTVRRARQCGTLSFY
jgi:ABC-2 type transport system permease protein